MSSLDSLIDLVKEFGNIMSVETLDVFLYLFFIIIGIWFFNQTKNRDQFIENLHLEKGPDLIYNFFMLIETIKNSSEFSASDLKEIKIYSAKISAFLSDDLVRRLSNIEKVNEHAELKALYSDLEKEMLVVKNRMNLNTMYSSNKLKILGVLEDLIIKYQFLIKPTITSFFFLVLFSSFLLFLLTLMETESITAQIGMYSVLTYFLSAAFTVFFIIDKIFERKGFLKRNIKLIALFFMILIVLFLMAKLIPRSAGLVLFPSLTVFNLLFVILTSNPNSTKNIIKKFKKKT